MSCSPRNPSAPRRNLTQAEREVVGVAAYDQRAAAASRPYPDQACTMIAEIYKWFADGFDTAALKDVKALLDPLNTLARAHRIEPTEERV